MQLYALNEEGKPIFANHANRQINYYCLECRDVVRLRGGLHRQNHFFHLKSDKPCHLSGKSMTHLKIQIRFFNDLPQNDCQLERIFPEIGRIADVYWISRRIVFEIQYSPIKAEEIAKRIAAYKSIGIEVIWIMHDERFNQKRLTAAEIVLQGTAHYFTNINEEGLGEIYDQYHICDRGIRVKSGTPILLNMNIYDVLDNKSKWKKAGTNVPKQVAMRMEKWNVFCPQDYIYLAYHDPKSEYLLEARQLENEWMLENNSGEIHWKEKAVYLLNKYMISPYVILFRHLLEKACKR